ncbi:MAG: hypothetical protein LUI06_00080 [Ruminococcus sp.]|nr:hypothetical protein [Ruminococcus sp.]
MPKQIKITKITKGERANRILALLAMIAAFIYGGSFILLLNELSSDDDVPAYIGIAAFAAYVVLFGLCVTHCIQGVWVYKRQEHYGVLFQAIIMGASAFAMLINLQLELAILFTSLGLDSLTEKVVGDSTYEDFISNQNSAWILLILAIAAIITIGIAAIVRLCSKANRRDK